MNKRERKALPHTMLINLEDDENLKITILYLQAVSITEVADSGRYHL